MKNYTGVHYNSLSVCVGVNNVIRCLSVRLSQIFTTIMLHSNSLVFKKLEGWEPFWPTRKEEIFRLTTCKPLEHVIFFSFSYSKKINSLGEIIHVLAFSFTVLRYNIWKS